MMEIEKYLDRIICGDNCEVMRKMPSESIDLVVTSPPYDDLRTYGGHSWNFETLAAQLVRVLKPGGVIVWVVADATVNGSETLTSMRQAIHFKDVCGLNVWDTMIWDKPWCQYGDTASRYAGTWEYCFVFSKGKPNSINILRDRPNVTAGTTRSTRTDRRVSGDALRVEREVPHLVKEASPRKSIWCIPKGETIENGDVSHPAPFPERLAADHILSWSSPGDVVLDPFAGSGTTLKAAKELNRQWCGIEINPEYCAIAESRLSQEVLQLETCATLCQQLTTQ
jgi:site-specific DNA-methyltransferase (adenine-specific)